MRSGILSGIYSGILSGILSGSCSGPGRAHCIWTSRWGSGDGEESELVEQGDAPVLKPGDLSPGRWGARLIECASLR